MTTSPFVTVGIPYYNDRAYLAAAIRSVLRQTYTDLELILLADAPTDGSQEIARGFSDSRIRLIEGTSNVGLACRLNQIAREARGRYLFRMDADDLMHPARVERQIALLSSSPPNTVVGSAAVEIDEHSRPRRIIVSRGPRGGGYHARGAFLHPTVAARVEWFRENPYSEAPVFRRTQDAELWVRSSRHSRFIVMPEALLYYRRTTSLSFDKYLWQAMALLKILSLPQSGNRWLRMRHAAFELAKLQLRFMQALWPRAAASAETPHGDPRLAEHARIIEGILS